MPPDLQIVQRTSSLTGPSELRGFDQTGASGAATWIKFGDAQSLPFNQEAASAQSAVVRVVGDLFSGAVAASTSTPRGLRLGNFVLDSRCFVPSSNTAQTSDEQVRRLRQQLWSRLDEEPLEDGVTHSAEEVVAEALAGSEEQLSAFARILETERSLEFSASMLRLAGRVGRTAQSDWRRAVITGALRSPSPTLREAAVEAVEQWEDSELLPLLRDHTESVPWLKAYIDDVIEDLGE